jgi:type IV pilus assembly protein PilN
MIKINLVSETPAAAATKRKKPEVSLGVKQGDLLLLSTLILAGLVIGGQWYLLDSERDDLQRTRQIRQAERDELQEFIRRVEELEATRDLLRHKIEVINDLKRNQRGPVRILDEISRALPDLVWLTAVRLEGTTITVSGAAMDENAVANYISNLDASPFFQEPSLQTMAHQHQIGTYNFTLTCVFTYAPQEIAGVSEQTGA